MQQKVKSPPLLPENADSSERSALRIAEYESWSVDSIADAVLVVAAGFLTSSSLEHDAMAIVITMATAVATALLNLLNILLFEMCLVNKYDGLFVGRLFYNGDAFVGGFCGGDGDLQHASYLSDILVGCAVGGGGVCALVAGDEVFALHLRGSLKVGKVQCQDTIADFAYKLCVGIGWSIF